MFYELTAKTHVRVLPSLLGIDHKEAVFEGLNKEYEGYISNETGFIICITEVIDIGEGLVIHGDGAPYYETTFKFLSYLPEMQEVVTGIISDVTNFGAFMKVGPVDGMIHLSQTMDDFVSVNKQKTITGKESKKALKVGDKCRARVIAISYKDLSNPKIGLTMRQPGLGNVKWSEEKKEKKVRAKKETKKK